MLVNSGRTIGTDLFTWGCICKSPLGNTQILLLITQLTLWISSNRGTSLKYYSQPS